MWLLNNISAKAILLYICISILFLTGSFFGLEIKLILSVCVFLLIVARTLRGCGLFGNELLTISVVTVFLVFTTCVALLNEVPFTSILSQTNAIFSTLLPIFFGMYALNHKLLKINDLINTLVVMSILLAVVKVSVVFLILFNVFEIDKYLEMQRVVFDATPIYLDSGFFTRINQTSDFIFPWAIAYIVNRKPFRPIFANLTLCLLLAAIVMSYSRYLWMYGFAIFLISWLFSSSSTRIKVIQFIFFGLGLCLLFYDLLVNVLNERFYGEYAQMSDEPRDEMFFSLTTRIANSPFFGEGIGSYDPHFIRFDFAKWNYELQWLALTANFGIFFSLIMAVFFSYLIYRQLINCNYRPHQRMLLAVLGLGWLCVGFFNCFLLNSSAGVIFFSVFILGLSRSTQSQRSFF